MPLMSFLRGHLFHHEAVYPCLQRKTNLCHSFPPILDNPRQPVASVPLQSVRRKMSRTPNPASSCAAPRAVRWYKTVSLTCTPCADLSQRNSPERMPFTHLKTTRASSSSVKKMTLPCFYSALVPRNAHIQSPSRARSEASYWTCWNFTSTQSRCAHYNNLRDASLPWVLGPWWYLLALRSKTPSPTSIL